MLVSCASREPQDRPLPYISLGDSLAVGVGASETSERGYAPLYRKALEKETGREARFFQLGMSGETTDSFIGGYPGGDAQLARAAKVLRENPGAHITLSIGANDLLHTADATDAERRAAIAHYSRNLSYILETLENASEPAPRIIILALYNPEPGSFTDEWIGRLNAKIRATAQQHGTSVAAGDQAFQGHEERYVHAGDIHPNDAGYRALARAFVRRLATTETGQADFSNLSSTVASSPPVMFGREALARLD